MKKNEWRNRYICLVFGVILAILCVFFAGMEADTVMHTSDLKPASATLISPELSRSTQTSAEELTGLRQVSVKVETDQRLRHRGMAGTELVLIMLAILLANTVFYKELNLPVCQKRYRRKKIYYLLHSSPGWADPLKTIYWRFIIQDRIISM